MRSHRDWLYHAFLAAIPGEAPKSIVEWAEQSVRITGSAKSETFDRTTGPWLNAPIECAKIPGRYALVLPIQSGKSTAGEIIIAYWIRVWNSGDIGYYWPSDEKALDRWDKYTEKRLQACKPVMERVGGNRHAWTRGFISFPHLNFSQLGAKTDRNVSSDTIRGLVLEELHDVQGGWTPGQLEKCFGRQTAVWNSVAFLISVASQKSDQFHQAFEAGTQEHWEVRCPGCSNPHHAANTVCHVMRTRWEDEQPQLGGLRYDATGCRRPNGTYDYNRLASTIFIQLPCGHRIHDNPMERRQLSLSGRYGEPRNSGARPNNRSFHMEAISNHDTDLIKLIEQKHLALRALKNGDPRLYEVYQREQECVFWDPANRPAAKPITLSERKKDREGLPNRKYRLAFFDYQEGRSADNELPHFWGCIWDIDAVGNVLVVWEGKVESEGELSDVVRRHDVKPICVGVDASFVGEEKYIYQFCLRFGFNAIKVQPDRGGEPRTWGDADKIPRPWTEPEPLCYRLPNQGPVKQDPNEEPLFWNISQAGAMNALAYLRASTERRFEIPGDVSAQFLEHFKAWNLEQKKLATNQIQMIWKKVSERAADHIFMCCCYLALWVEQLGIVDTGLPTAEQPEPEPEPEPELSIDDRLRMM